MWGPYTARDGRQRLVLHLPNGKRTTVSYPKYLMEKRLGRYLEPDETVDHIDENPLNNEEGNLQVLTRSGHAALDARRRNPQEFTCPTCGGNFVVEGSKLKDRQRGKAGPFCSRSCVGTYAQSIQKGGKPLLSKVIRPSYSTNKRSGAPAKKFTG